MPVDKTSRLHPHALAIAILAAGLLVGWFAYAPGMGGTLHFDDYPNLQGLATVHDSSSAFRFIATGVSGPLGRPIALASFTPQAYAWPDATDILLRTNILIHLLNGTLVIWFLYLLGLARYQPERQAALVAAAAGTIWMLMPLLASSSLFIVQRMTTLSALFMLVGAVGYMYAREASDRRPVAALFGMTLALGIGAALSMLTKENGALLFLFILAVEFALLRRPSAISSALWKTWFGLVLVAPLIALSFYLISIVPYSEEIILRRDFNGFERLITQAEILWKYLYLAFLPNIPSLGPFHDDYPIQRSLFQLTTILSVGAWIAVIGAAITIRRKAPLFTFAVAWYVLGHLMESTTVSLELYFEHRNYLPLIGPVYALVATLAQLEMPWRRIAGIATAAYAALLAIFLFSLTSLWGTPPLAAEMWHIYKPSSLRAVQYVARIVMQQEGSRASRRVMARYSEAHPDDIGIKLQILLVSCDSDPESDHSDALITLERELPRASFHFSVVTAYQQLYDVAREGNCSSIDDDVVLRIGHILLANPRFKLPLVRHNLHAVLARIGIDRRDFGLTMTHMEEALSAYHNPNTLLLAISILNSGGLYDLSWDLLVDARDRPSPRHPLRALQWKQELDRIEMLLLSLNKSRGSSS